MPLAAGAAVAELIRSETSLTPQLKWPNDVLISGKKVAGILCEGVHGAGRLRGVLIGVGLNINVPPDGFPEELRPIATSLLAESGNTYEIGALAQALHAAILDRVTLLSADRGALLDLWREHDVTTGRAVKIGEVTGTAVGINAEGALLVETPNGTQTIRSGEIEWVAE
jgi:BirA family biotin operon repressor/biotin-[acetyl-CoA-carboxylase] ligase